MKRKVHEINDLLNGLVPEDEKLPKNISTASERSRQHVDKIVEKMNQEQEQVTPVPKPVYSKPPKRKKVVTEPEPVSHFSEEPSQNPVVRMHDRLLEDAMPKPDTERKPTAKTDKKSVNQSSKKKKKAITDSSQKKSPKKNFRIEIKEDLPPDIPRDTRVVEQLRQEQLEKTLASVPPKTPEQIRKEQVRKRAAKIREQMKKQAENAKQEEIVIQVSESEPENIQNWEDELSELSEKNASDEFQQVFEDVETLETPVLSDMPEIPEMSSQDTSFLKITEELQKDMLSDDIKPVSETSKEDSKQQTGFFYKISGMMQNLFQRDVQKNDSVIESEENSNPEFLETQMITEVLMTPKEENIPDLSFEQTTLLQTVKLTEQQDKPVPKRKKQQKKTPVAITSDVESAAEQPKKKNTSKKSKTEPDTEAVTEQPKKKNTSKKSKTKSDMEAVTEQLKKKNTSKKSKTKSDVESITEQPKKKSTSKKSKTKSDVESVTEQPKKKSTSKKSKIKSDAVSVTEQKKKSVTEEKIPRLQPKKEKKSAEEAEKIDALISDIEAVTQKLEAKPDIKPVTEPEIPMVQPKTKKKVTVYKRIKKVKKQEVSV
ncbi:MAG: hypothetical protein K2K06_04200 [Oscillospiraceae bacterium]|nr:hypothetical protein [Oscillospiraceae bacterium]